MTTNEIISALDEEISRLRQVRDLLAGVERVSKSTLTDTQFDLSAEAAPKRGRGRPKGSTNKTTSFNPSEFSPKRRTMSPEGRARIAAAQRARWAQRNGTAAGADAEQRDQPQGASGAKAKKKTGSTKRVLSKGASKTASKKGTYRQTATSSSVSGRKGTASKKIVPTQAANGSESAAAAEGGSAGA